MTQEARCPKCHSGISLLSVQIKTTYPLICIQGRGFDFDKYSPVPKQQLDPTSKVICETCGHEGQFCTFIQKTDPDSPEALKKKALVEKYGKDDDGEPLNFHNFYRHCGEEWEDWWSCGCNDECPHCHAEIEPYKSEEEE